MRDDTNVTVMVSDAGVTSVRDDFNVTVIVSDADVITMDNADVTVMVSDAGVTTIRDDANVTVMGVTNGIRDLRFRVSALNRPVTLSS